MKNTELLVLGNGFDLQVGLESRYENFFNFKYKDIDRENLESLYNSFGKLIAEIQQLDIAKKNVMHDLKMISQSNKSYSPNHSHNSESYKKSLKKYEDDYEITFNKLKERLDDFLTYENLNYWDYVFLSNFSNTNLWCDVEKVILEHISEFENSNLVLNKSDFSALQLLLKQNSKYQHTLLLYIYLNSPNFKYNKQNNKSDKFFPLKNNCLNIPEFLLEELAVFEDSFKEYLNETVLSNETYLEKSNKLFKCLVEKDNIYILNFNYTNFIEEEHNSMKITMNNIHGSLSLKEIIFGIDISDSMTAKNNLINNFYGFTKTNRVITLYNHIKKPLPSPKNTNKIIFFGHSLSSADYSYFLSMFDYYNIYDSEVSLVFYYTNYKSSVKRELLKAITDLLMKYGESFMNKSKQENLMHKLILEGRLALVLIE